MLQLKFIKLLLIKATKGLNVRSGKTLIRRLLRMGSSNKVDLYLQDSPKRN